MNAHDHTPCPICDDVWRLRVEGHVELHGTPDGMPVGLDGHHNNWTLTLNLAFAGDDIVCAACSSWAIWVWMEPLMELIPAPEDVPRLTLAVVDDQLVHVDDLLPRQAAVVA